MAGSVQIYVSPDIHKEWKFKALYEGITVSELVRRAMATYMETAEKVEKASAYL